MMFRARPERQKMVQAPRQLVTRMGIDRLEQPQRDPNVHGQDMKVLGDSAINDGGEHGTEAQAHHFDRAGVFSGEAEGSGVLVVDFVDVFVEPGCVEAAVRPVVPCVLHDEENGYLVGHLP